jgi:hypothetical protein
MFNIPINPVAPVFEPIHLLLLPDEFGIEILFSGSRLGPIIKE